MYPLDFEEFCWVINRNDLIPLIKKHFEELKSLNQLHQTVMKFFRQYLLVGGMPQAIVEFIKTNDYTKVDQVKRDILN